MLALSFWECHGSKNRGVVYPTLTLFAITITGNHYITDAVGGALLIIASFLTMEIGIRRRLFVPALYSWVRSKTDAVVG